MFNQYKITIIKAGENIDYTCELTNKVVYRVRYIICPCGVVYPEPIVVQNSTIDVSLFVEGGTFVETSTIYKSSSSDPDFSELIAQLSEKHSIGIDIISHSINKAIVKYGGQISSGSSRCSFDSFE